MFVSTLILKPTKFCNAGCTYCSAPPEVNGAPKWDLDRFKFMIAQLRSRLHPGVTIIFHGGEPMLCGPDFYRDAHAHLAQVLPGAKMAMQTNLLGYTSRRWKDVFHDVFRGSISTSFDPDERNREYKGSVELYTRVFMDSLWRLVDDGIRPLVIGTYAAESIPAAFSIYERALGWRERAPALRFNYRYPAGRDAGAGASISPQEYGEMLVGLYDRWIVDMPDFPITPLDQMLKKVIGLESGRCPWTKACGGQFMEIEPNGDVYNCGEFADLADPQYRYGNIDEHDAVQLLASPAATAMKRRRWDLPQDCLTCRHFEVCEGGCARDSVLFDRGLGGKFYYCQSWMRVFDRIQDSIRTGEADAMVARYGVDPAAVRRTLQPLAA